MLEVEPFPVGPLSCFFVASWILWCELPARLPLPLPFPRLWCCRTAAPRISWFESTMQIQSSGCEAWRAQHRGQQWRVRGGTWQETPLHWEDHEPVWWIVDGRQAPWLNWSIFFYEFTCLIKCLVNLIFVIFWNLWIWIVSGWRWHAAPSRCVSTRKKMSYGLVLKNQEFKWKSLRWLSFSDSGLVTLPLALNLGYFWSHHFESLVILLNCGVKIINPTKQIT